MTKKSAHAAAHLRPRCSGIAPDADSRGYYCTRCGYELVQVRDWFRHGLEWRHPEVWQRRG